MNRQPYQSPPRWWEPKLTPWCVRISRGYRRRQLSGRQKIMGIEVQGGEHVKQALAAGQGVLITPNHSVHYDSAALYVAADQIDTPLYYLTAWQVFGMASRWEQWFMQKLGCFSIDRESIDRQAFKQAVQVLQEEPHPLVIFPEGDIYHVNDCVTPFRDGAAAIALSAAKRAKRPVAIVPCGIKFWYLDDPLPQLHEIMGRLEERVYLRPQPDAPLTERIYRLAGALLALKELDYLGGTSSGPLPERKHQLMEAILARLETRHAIKPSGASEPERVKALRQKIIQKLEADNFAKLPLTEQHQLQFEMEDLFFVIQLYSYPGDYLYDGPSAERLAETIDKLEEDVLGQDLPSVHGRRTVQVRFGEPIVLAPEGERREVGALTQQIHGRVQGLLDELNAVRENAGVRG